jgi:cytochrome b561
MRTLPTIAAVVVLAAASVARAQQPQPSPTPATPPGAAVPSTPAPAQANTPRAEPTKPKSQSDEMNFNLFGNEEKKSPLEEAREKERVATLERKVRLRRQLLQWHQALGFVTLGLLAITDIIGTLNYYDKYAAPGTDTGKFSTWHEGLGIGTAGLFGVTGILALAAPNPYPKPLRLDAALIHKVSMAVATACFVAQVVLGPVMAVSDGKLYQRDLALAHLVIGWGAFAFMGAGTLAFVF